MVGRDLSGFHPDAQGVPDPAALSRRFGALVIDWILCVMVSGTFASPLTQGWAPVAVLIAEYAFFIGLFGYTPGMWIVKIACVGVADGRPVGVVRGLVRGVLLALVVPALIMDGDRRGWHDRVAGTIVVRRTA